MNIQLIFRSLAIDLPTICCLLLFLCIGSVAQSTAFNYQGKLGDSGSAANGTYSFQFKLFDAATAGNQVSSTQTADAVVVNGIFTTQLDFGAAPFSTGQSLWLEIAVRPGTNGRPNTIGSYTILTPRRQLNSVPFAVSSQNVSGIVSIANGGTGGSTQNFVDLNSNQAIGGNKNFTGILSGDGSGLTNIHATFPWQIVANNVQQAVSNTGYVITNLTRQVRITLPVEPLNVGDVIRVSSGGAGGWKIVQNAGQSIFLGNLSFVGTNWIAHEAVRGWAAVASSADGSKLVAVSNNQIYTSDDSGATWLPHSVSGNFVSVASSADGTKLVAVTVITSLTSGGHIYTSTDSGANWTESAETRRDWQSVASSADGTKLVAVVGHSTVGKIYTSADSGATWSPHVSDGLWQSVASSADGSKLVAVLKGGQIYTSADSGATWAPQDSSRIWVAVASSSDGSNLVAVTNADTHLSIPAAIFTSTDSGLTWVQHSIAANWQSVASSADGSKLVAVAIGGQIYISADAGANWTPHEGNRNWYGVASSDDGSKLVAVVGGGQIYTSSGTSSSTTTPGTAGELVGGEKAAIELQYVGNGSWIMLSHEGSITGH